MDRSDARKHVAPAAAVLANRAVREFTETYYLDAAARYCERSEIAAPRACCCKSGSRKWHRTGATCASANFA